MFRTPDFLQEAPLFRRLIPSIGKRYAKWFKPRFMVARRHGIQLLLDQQNPVDRVILTRGYWEKQQLDYLLRMTRRLHHANSRLLFLDIGSHWGLYSILMKRNFPAIEVHAYEPEPVNHAQLMANLLINDLLDVVQVHRLALSDHEGEIYLTRPEKSNRGVTRVAEGGDSNISGNMIVDKVCCLPLDSLLHATNAVFVAKIDVEGHEISVLKGMGRLLRENQFFLQIESFQDNFPLLSDLMTKMGYFWLETIDRDHYFTNTSILLKQKPQNNNL